MGHTRRRVKLFLVMLAGITAACLIGGARGGSAQERSGLLPQAQRGKQIYLKSETSDGGQIKVRLGSDHLEVPAAAFACVNCHGLQAKGTSEGGLQPPPITWATLTAPHTSALTNRERPAYTEELLARAIRNGLDPAGVPLHPGMPQYELTAGQMADLIAYLKQVGQADDLTPGLADKTIKLGAALPLTGPLAQIGADIKATVEAYFAEVNAQGGIYGRQFELVVADSQGDPTHTLQATQQLIEQAGVFALVGSFEAQGNMQANEYLRRSEVALVGPVTLSPRLATPPNPYVFYLLPTFSDQARVLVDFAAAKAARRPARVALIYADGEFDADALAGLRAQVKLYQMETVFEYGYERDRFAPERVGAPLAQSKPDYIFFFGAAAQFTALAHAMAAAQLHVPLLSSVVMIGRAAFDVPPAVAAQTYLAYPAALPTQSDFAEFIALMQRKAVTLRSPAFQSVAFAAAKTFVEATKLSGREISRPQLLNALEQLHDYQTGVVPPLTFGPNRRVGADSCSIVGLDLSHKQYVPVGERLTPKDKP